MSTIYNTVSRIILTALFLTPLYCFANSNQDPKVLFNEGDFKEAFPLFKQEAEKGSKPAMYRLAHMYQNGLGTEKDIEKAAYWFEQAAADYSFVLYEESDVDNAAQRLAEGVSEPSEGKSLQEGFAYALDKMDTDTPETKALLDSIYNGDFFGLMPYKTNFFLPVSYGTHKPFRISSATHINNYTPEVMEEYGHYAKNTEVQFQLSLQKPLSYDLFGWNEYISFAYTQKVWWQLYSESGPFRETNYLPELFLTVPTSDSIDAQYGLKAVRTGFLHESNGQEGYRSRSWNRLYLSGIWQWSNLFLNTRMWYRLSEDEKYNGYYDGEVNPITGQYDPNAKGDDNPDIHYYLGYGDITFNYLFGGHEIGGLFRYNFDMGGQERGAIDLHWSYPFFNSKNTFWYVKFFNGYGESLIDYDRCITKTSFGFAFSRGLY